MPSADKAMPLLPPSAAAGTLGVTVSGWPVVMRHTAPEPESVAYGTTPGMCCSPLVEAEVIARQEAVAQFEHLDQAGQYVIALSGLGLERSKIEIDCGIVGALYEQAFD